MRSRLISQRRADQVVVKTRYRIADTYLAFWTRFIEPALALLDRGRSQQVLENILRQWPDYRGRAIEPIVRDSVARLLPLHGADAHTVASFWTRDGRTEVDLVGIDGQGSKRRVSFIGSIKWRRRRPFSGSDASALAAQLPFVPGVDDRTKLLAVSSSGFDVLDVPSGGRTCVQRFTAAAEDELAGWGIGPRPRPECASAIQCERRLRQARVIVSLVSGKRAYLSGHIVTADRSFGNVPRRRYRDTIRVSTVSRVGPSRREAGTMMPLDTRGQACNRPRLESSLVV